MTVLLTSGCGSASRSGGSSKRASGGASALSAEARSAATGDVPDNQIFLTFHNPAAKYSIQYPEGWSRAGSGNETAFKDKDNTVRVVIGRGSEPTLSSVKSELARLKASTPSLRAGSPRQITLKSGPAIKVTYSTRSAPNSVTDKRVTLMVDRYVLSHNGRVATIDLGTPKGVDNVDAYRQISNSFRWR